MSVKVLVVDDSRFFQRRVTEILNADPLIEVVGSAGDGAEAIMQVARLKPDVITMDIEMPVMDGITAVRKIMARHPVPVLMFSSLTTDGAQATLDALDAGAVDFLPKRFEDISKDREEAKRLLCHRVRTIARTRTAALRRAPVAVAGAVRPVPAVAPVARHMPRGRPVKLVAIGTSTGGPVALLEVLRKLPASCSVPLLLVQHMPATFTPAFAKRLDQQCAIRVREAQDGDRLEPGLALLAPGGSQMSVERSGHEARVRIREGTADETYKPSVDITFSAVAKLFPADTLAVVLTGMGADGREGVRALKQGGSTVWVQDEASCVVYGMPAAVAEAGLADQVIALPEIGSLLAHQV